MESSITIESSGKQLDGCYFMGLTLFWMVWTPLTLLCTWGAITHFHFFWVIWLAGAYVGVVLPPVMMFRSRLPQKIEVTEDALIIHRPGLTLQKFIRISRDHPLRLHLGHYRDSHDDVESVVSLDLIYDMSTPMGRIRIAPLVHVTEKRRMLHQIEAFLRGHGFDLVVDDAEGGSRG